MNCIVRRMTSTKDQNPVVLRIMEKNTWGMTSQDYLKDQVKGCYKKA